MSNTRADVRQAIARNTEGRDFVMGTVSAMSTNKVRAAGRLVPFPADHFNDAELYIYSGTAIGQSRQVYDHALDAASPPTYGELTPFAAFSPNAVANDLFELHPHFGWTVEQFNDAINRAHYAARNRYLVDKTDTTLMLETGIYDYTIPSGFRYLSNVQYHDGTKYADIALDKWRVARGSGLLQIDNPRAAVPLSYIFADYVGGPPVYPNLVSSTDTGLRGSGAATDTTYFGVTAGKWHGLHLNLTQAAAYTGSLVWKYWNGSSWVVFTPTTLNDLKSTGAVLIDWDPDKLVGWTANSLHSSDDSYFIQLTLAAIMTTIPYQGGRIACYGPGLRLVGQAQATVPTADTDVITLPLPYIIAKATAAVLGMQRGGNITDVQEQLRFAAYWEQLADKELAGLRTNVHANAVVVEGL